ncbi:Telomerase reverse transcriptase [Penicillium atrosanguineum]|uniref:Telomerase reverse transcriptase n=1 Tax=Penicillium atrosanguineum TaxID=1132637 RepID=A0A9W9UCQ1_9EURO|nr:Telomerase reverse transcriptase [Penicillium atrosanguineum]
MEQADAVETQSSLNGLSRPQPRSVGHNTQFPAHFALILDLITGGFGPLPINLDASPPSRHCHLNMGKKRKRPGKAVRQGPAPSRPSNSASSRRFKSPKAPDTRNGQTTHPVISLYYRELLTLRQYLLTHLPVSSKLRRRRIASLASSTAEPTSSLAHLLDSTLVGVLKQSTPKVDSERQRDYRAFTQSQSRSILVSTDTGPTSPQSEVVDFAIESLFRKAGYQRPEHLLTHGFRRPAVGQNAVDMIPGVVAQFPNHNVRILKEAPWADVLGLLGQSGDEIMIRLLFDCGIFAPIDARRGVYFQLSGLPLSGLQQIGDSHSKVEASNQTSGAKKSSHVHSLREARGPNSIILLRRRMLYSKTAGPSKGNAPFGLGVTHVFNRCSSLDSSAQTVHVMKYIFPREFGLNNVFTVSADSNSSVDMLSNHNRRESEIARNDEQRRQRRCQSSGDQLRAELGGNLSEKVPKRLRGKAMELISRLRLNHARCSYGELLKYYCPDPTGPWKLGVAASPVKAAAKPDKPGSSLEYSLVTAIPWLVPPKLDLAKGTTTKISMSDFQKRIQLLHEFIFFVFDSVVIPLVRANFYVTESQTHRYHLFYFRHDVWQRLTEQPLAELKATMFEELEPKKANRYRLTTYLELATPSSQRSRLAGKKFATSINSTITPIYNMLTYERQQAPVKLGASISSVGDMHPRLKGFKVQLTQQLPLSSVKAFGELPRLYFVKLDIQACFDTIPQQRLLRLVEELVSQETYHITKHVEINPRSIDPRGYPSRKFAARAAPVTKQQHLAVIVASGAHPRKPNTVFVDTVSQRVQSAEELLDLLDEHVRNNLVKMGREFYRQRSGIPQGSVLSSLLCNFFYAELERTVLGFLQPSESLLMRLIDDFLLITTNPKQATQFLQVMLRGQPTYGVTVNPTKSMANFTAAVDGIHIPRLEGTSLFPYCGCLIDTHTLELHQDRDRMLDGGESAAVNLSNALTVEMNRLPGRTFTRKVLTTFRLQMHQMYLDEAHNSRTTVLANLYTSLIASAMKMYRYMKSLRGRAHPEPPIIVQTIHALIMQTINMIHARRASSTAPLKCFVQLSHVQYLTAAAYRFVLKRKQTRYAPVLRWLDLVGKESRPRANGEAVRMMQVVKRGDILFEGWRF